MFLNEVGCNSRCKLTLWPDINSNHLERLYAAIMTIVKFCEVVQWKYAHLDHHGLRNDKIKHKRMLISTKGNSKGHI